MRLLALIDNWFDAQLCRSEKRKCEKRGHQWIKAGGLYPTPMMWMECARYGCDAQTEATPAGKGVAV